ncbi:hypothetical protein PMAYCL1PPCAC_07467 [Pristionchus mayeri]|uniref:MIF4G domain-containing protein n=1 Tax=Pristionchus mayeri TaxID=1317129 RepID=A0AAN4ZG44_9BILA|nr:hypothetical protein PMAYCL1PPCAC_07467 [Pristionchus mayeri]
MQHAMRGIRQAGERAEYKKKHEEESNRQGSAGRQHQNEYPWRAPKEREGKEEKNRVLLRSIRSLLRTSTPERKEALVAVFLEYRVHESPLLNEIVSIIFDAAVELPSYCHLYATMCAAQVSSELRKTRDASTGSLFKSEILKKVQETFNTKTISGKVAENLRKARMGHINFIGHLYLERLITMKFMHYRVLDLLKSINIGWTDEDLIECAVLLLEKIGRKMEDEEEKVEGCRVQIIFDLLENAQERASNRVRALIVSLVECRRDNWKEQREVFPLGRRDQSRGRRKEEEDKENTNQMAERRQHPGRGGRGRGGRGGWEGERRINPRQEESARPARPMQILMRRDHSPGKTLPAPPVDAISDTTSSTSTTTLSSMRNQRGNLDSTGVLAMLTGAAPAPPFKQREGAPSAPPPSAAAMILREQSRPEARRVDQKRHEKTGSRDAAKAFATSSTKEATYLGGKKVMRDACRIVTESGELSEYLVNNMMTDFLSDTNRDFRVIAAVGPQTTGKSTILSMIAGNQPLDLFRQYVFRPSSREAVEQSKHQSTKVSIYVSKARNIFIDCQPMSCVSILDEQLQQGGRERGGTRGGERLALQAHIENLQILAWTLQVSHSVLVCHDWFIDLDIVKQLRTAELLRGATDEISALNQLPKLAPTRKTNLLFVHTRARPDDFRPANRLDRVALLKKVFGGSMRIRMAELPASQANWNGEYSLPRPPLETIYFPLGEMKLREMSTQWQEERAAAAGGATGGHNRSNLGPLSPVPRTPQQRAREKEKETNRVKDFIADLSGAVPFDEGIVDLRRVVHLLPRESFTPQTAPLLTETQWFRFACGAWRDQTFRTAVSLLESTIAARRKPRVKRETAASDAATERMRTMKISENA